MIKGFKKMSEASLEAFKDLKKIQKGEVRLVRTGDPFIDDHIQGLLPSDVVLYSGLSGHGKSETLFRTRENILDTKINPDAKDYVWVNYNLEVKMLNVILRGVHRKINKKKSEILHQPFTKEEKEIVREYSNTLNDDRQYVRQEPTSAEEFYETSREFLTEHANKKACFISLDHAALLKGEDTTKNIEKLVAYINRLKLEFHNAYFFIISQLNRNVLGRVDERSNKSCPNASDIFASSAMDFICSYNIIVFNAFKVGISEFMKFSPERYDYLSEHFTDEDSKGKVSFQTEGKLFYKVVKTRESDVIWKDLYIKDMDIAQEDLNKLKSEKKETHKPQKPVFTATNPEPDPFKSTKPNFNLEDAFAEPKQADDSAPF